MSRASSCLKVVIRESIEVNLERFSDIYGFFNQKKYLEARRSNINSQRNYYSKCLKHD